eukprot:832741_1
MADTLEVEDATEEEAEEDTFIMADTVDVEEDMDVATMLPRVSVMIIPLPYMMSVEEAVVVLDGTVDHIQETEDHTQAEDGIMEEIEDGTADRIPDHEEAEEEVDVGVIV